MSEKPDINNLRFYSEMAREFHWQTDIIHFSVVEQTLTVIADNYAAQVEEISRLRIALKDERERADSNFASCERIKGKLSDAANENKALEQAIREKDKRIQEQQRDFVEVFGDMQRFRDKIVPSLQEGLAKQDEKIGSLEAELAAAKKQTRALRDRVRVFGPSSGCDHSTTSCVKCIDLSPVPEGKDNVK